MQFRKATLDELMQIMAIIAQAQQYLKLAGIDQWQDGYPCQTVVKKDLEEGTNYVLVREGEVLATAVLQFGGDPNYEEIYEGQWLGSQAYGVIHRIAIADRYKGQGLGAIMLSNMENICLKRGVNSIRIDTHENNHAMQRMLQKSGFKYCGRIFLANGHPRIGLEKIFK